MATKGILNRQTASEYRSRAERCKRQAAETKDPGEKAHFLELVRLYQKLAEKTEQLETKPSKRAS